MKKFILSMIFPMVLLAQQTLYVNSTFLPENKSYFTRNSDLDGDGRLDVFHTERCYENGESVGIKIHFYGNADKIDGDSELLFYKKSYSYGISFTSGYDINGDGYQDMVVGDSYASSNRGFVYIYFGGEEMDNEPDMVISGEDNLNGYQGDLFFGGKVDISGDFNGDGENDLLVQCSGQEMSWEGIINIFYGGENLSGISNQYFIGEEGELLGSQLSVGDLNGDGYSDLAVHRVNETMTTYSELIKIFKGSPSGLIDDNLEFDYNGSAMSNSFTCSGDYNGDGKKDLAFLYDHGFIKIIYFNDDFTVESEQNYTPSFSNTSFLYFSNMNINNDGFDDIIVNGNIEQDTACVVYSGPLDFTKAPQYTYINNDSTTFITPPFRNIGDIFNKGYDVINCGPGSSKSNRSLRNLIVRDYEDSSLMPTSTEEVLPNGLSLSQNYPNPFNPTTTISFNLPMESDVKLEVYNTKGEMVKSLLNNSMKSGTHSIEFNGSNLSSGVYYYKLTVGKENHVKKMILIK